MSSAGAARRAAVPKSNARAEARRKNGAKSRGPKTSAGKASSAQNALKHGLRAQKYVVLPQEDGAEFAELEAALIAELAPVGALQTLLARRVAVAAWRLERADRLEAEVLEFRSYENANAGLALMRDANGTRSVETLLRYRGAATAELMRSFACSRRCRPSSRRRHRGVRSRPSPLRSWCSSHGEPASTPTREMAGKPDARRAASQTNLTPRQSRTNPNRAASRTGLRAGCTSPSPAGSQTNPRPVAGRTGPTLSRTNWGAAGNRRTRSRPPAARA